MIYALLTTGAVSLLVGIALLLASRRDAAQRFSRDIGRAFIVQSIWPVSYLAWQNAAAPWALVGAATLLASAAGYIGLLILGVSHLAGRAVSRRAVLLLIGALAIVGSVTLQLHPRIAQTVSGVAQLTIGVIATLWLWRAGAAERLTGLLLVLLGLNQFVFVALGEDALALQGSMASVLRVGLGLTLLYTVLDRSAAESRRLRQNFRRMTEHSHQGVAVMRGEQMLYANPALLRIYGLERLDDLSGNWRDVTMPSSERAEGRERHRRIVAGEVDQVTWEGQRFRRDGTSLHLRFSAWRIDWDGQPAEQVVLSDDTAHHRTMQTLLHQATHDKLTGLPNRSALLQRLRDLCAAQAPGGFALMLLDVDRFKLFNEAHGPSLGDEVLKALAEALSAAMAGRAEVMRLGEDEFALLAPAADGERTARELEQGVRQLVAQPLELPGHAFFLDVSMGVAIYPGTTRDPEALLRAANAAMHEAKHTAGTSVQFAEERFERGSGATLDAEQALRSGLKNEEFHLEYQPKVNARSGALVGFEALARWQRPGIGPVSPLDFIRAAERTGLIGALGELILTQACQQIADWRAAFERVVPVAVNVSPLQLLNPAFPQLVMRTLARFDVPAELLTLEITETAAVDDLAQARGQIGQLRAHGVDVAIDDFGAGFSSLNMLRGLPLKTVKIDRSLINPMPAPDAVAIVKAICDLAAVLRLEVVAEGVETAEQAAAALGAGCEVMQGYLYARPLAAADAARWLTTPRTATATVSSRDATPSSHTSGR